jgi:hypothetical protein
MPSYNRHVYDIAGYVFKADLYCPEHIVETVTSQPEYDGWALAPSVAHTMTTEQNLDEIAFHFTIDRTDERSFDSGDFPKVLLVGDTGQGDTEDRCAVCGEEL